MNSFNTASTPWAEAFPPSLQPDRCRRDIGVRSHQESGVQPGTTSTTWRRPLDRLVTALRRNRPVVLRMVATTAATTSAAALRGIRSFGVVLAMALPLSAAAIDWTIPRFEDLQPKWAHVEAGQSPAAVALVMGEPTARTETVVAGVNCLELEWKDIKGNRYTAKFVAGRLYAKQVTNTR